MPIAEKKKPCFLRKFDLFPIRVKLHQQTIKNAYKSNLAKLNAKFVMLSKSNALRYFE